MHVMICVIAMHICFKGGDMMKRLGGGIYQRIRRTYIALVFSTCDEYPDDVLCIPHIRARPNGEQNLITKPKTNEQTFGFLVKTRMEYKHRTRMTSKR